MTILTHQTGQFSGYTLAELRALVLKRMRVTNTARYSPTSGNSDYDWVDDSLNRAQEEFVKRTLCLRTYAIVELKANYRTYRLPWNFLDFMAAYYYNSELSAGYQELTVKSIEELNDEVSNWRTNTGDPEYIYIDRIYGNNWMFGLYPIPDTDGETITFDSEYGSVVEWVCPLYAYNTEYGVIVRMTDTDEYFLNTDAGVVGKVGSANRNLWLEYYRLPEKLVIGATTTATQGNQYPEIPREYHLALVDWSAGDLLENNPEDSAEFKRSMVLKKTFDDQVKTYINKRKRPVAGHNLQAKPFVWSWVKGMDFRKEMF